MKARIKTCEFDVADQPADYWGWIKDGNYDFEWLAYDTYLRHDHIFVDLGAWVGAHTLYASTKAKRVIAVEPDPIAFPILEQNIRHRGIAHRLAIAGHEGELKLGSSELGWSTTRTNCNAGAAIESWREGQTCIAPCTTLRKFCADLPDPLFIKIDVEGSEEEILKDLDFFRERKPTVLIELHAFWWKNEVATDQDFKALKAIYNSPERVYGDGTWILCSTPSQ